MNSYETYIKVKGEWHYLYRAVDKEGKTIDFLFTKKRDKQAAKRFFIKAINRNGLPDKVTIDKSGSNLSALNYINQTLALLAIFADHNSPNKIFKQYYRTGSSRR